MSNEVNFNILKVSGKVKTEVEQAIQGGVRGAADTKEEYAKLQELLSGTQNADEQKFIESKMKEYETDYKLKDLRNRASEYIQKFVDSAKAVFKPKKALDRDEADTLLTELRKAIADNRPEDAEYIREELHQAGFDNLLKEFDAQANSGFGKEISKPVEGGTPVQEESNKDKEVQPIKQKDTPIDSVHGEPTTEPAKPRKQRKPNPFDKHIKPDEPQKSKPNKPKPPVEKPVDNKPSKSVKNHITEENRAEGSGAARKVLKETESYVANNDNVKKAFSSVNHDTAYSFFKTYLEEDSDKVNGIVRDTMRLNDIFNKLNLQTVKKAIDSLLIQAREMELSKTPEWQTLKNDLATIKKEVGLNGDPNKRQSDILDKDIRALINLMDKKFD